MPENKSTDNFEFSIKTHSNLKFSGAGFVLLKLCPYCNYLQYIKFDFIEQKFSPFTRLLVHFAPNYKITPSCVRTWPP